MFPKAPKTMMQERYGINAVASAAARMGAIWRETTSADVGIDGHLEFVTEDGFATGRTIAAQVKSGPSFFGDDGGTFWKFYAEERHMSYWEHYPLPVLLILHNESAGKSYWVDARQQIRSSFPGSPKFINVPKGNVLQGTSAADLFESAGAFSGEFIPDIRDIMMSMIRARNPNGSFHVSYLDLFTYGLTNVARSLYFGMDIARNAAEYDLAVRKSEFGVGMGSIEYEFLFGYVKFLLLQRIADVDFADCLVSWKGMEMMPTFVAPLTTRGRLLVRVIHDAEAKMVADGRLGSEGSLHVAQEGFVQMVEQSYLKRLPRIHTFQKRMREDLNAP